MRSWLLTAVVLLAPGTAEAACTWEWVCDAAGDCVQVPICNNALEVARINGYALRRGDDLLVQYIVHRLRFIAPTKERLAGRGAPRRA